MNREGFTLLEVVLAMAVLAVAALSVMGIQVTAARARAVSASMTELARSAAEAMPLNLGQAPPDGTSPCRLPGDHPGVHCTMVVTSCDGSGHPLCAGIWSNRAALVELRLSGRHEATFALATLWAGFPP